jgi:Tfp pilus assembly PilM family ATPase
MHSSTFFKLFPPPKFMIMKHAGLEISDDAIRAVEYAGSGGARKMIKHAAVILPEGLSESGDVKNEKALQEILTRFDRENKLSYVKVSLPEEKAYLFQTDVPSTDVRSIAQNIEFKLEENVPLSAADAVFYFDMMPAAMTGGALRASVSVVPRTYVEHQISMLRASGIFPVAFEVVPKAIARAVVNERPDHAAMVIHVMNKKTGLYIVSSGVVCFTSTVALDSRQAPAAPADIASLVREVTRTYTYWMSHSGVAIDAIILLGRNALALEGSLRSSVAETGLSVSIANVWQNIFDLNRYIPPVPRDESLDFAVAAGLAMEA